MTVDHNSRLGAKLGPRIAMLVVQAIAYSSERLHTLKHKLAMAVFHSISDEISEEVDVTLGPFLRMMHDATPEDHPAYPAIHFMHTVSGQLKAIAGTGLQMSGLLGAFSSVVNNELADVVYNIIRANPALLPDPSTIAQAYATGLVDQAEAEAGIGAQGIQYGWAQRMLALAVSRLDMGTSVELVRRGVITPADLTSNMLWQGFSNQDAQNILALVGIPLSPADLALAVLRGNMAEADGTKQAYESGVSPDQFKILLDNTGEPPGLMQLLEGYRRGFIDKATLDRGILQSRYRNEWIPLLEQLRYEPMSVADAVNATVQNQLDATKAAQYADQNGLQPGDFQILLNTAGEPLSRTEMEQLYNRGQVTKDQVIQALRESRLKNKYNEFAFDLHQRVIPAESLSRILRYNGVAHDEAVKIAMESGYSEHDATLIVSSGAMERLRVYKDRVIASIVSLVEDNLMSDADATNLISSLGYTSDDAHFILQSADFRRSARIQAQVVTSIRGKFVSHHIDTNEASGLLDSLGINPTQRDNLIALWTVESEAYVRTLTEAQIVKAVKLELISADEGTSRLEALGYNPTDASLLIQGA